MDDERLKNLGGGNYWKELLDRIRDIRSSEKVMYRQVLDLYATSVDYDPKSAESIAFFKMVQNKLHYAAHGHTAAEVIYERADAEKPFMGLTTFSGDFPTAKDIVVAKNYLSEEELKILNNIVSGYFDFAEVQAIRSLIIIWLISKSILVAKSLSWLMISMRLLMIASFDQWIPSIKYIFCKNSTSVLFKHRIRSSRL